MVQKKNKEVFIIQKLINFIMLEGKKSKAEKLLILCFLEIQEKGEDPFHKIDALIKSIRPFFKLRTIRLGRKYYQIPFPLKKKSQNTIALKWFIQSTRSIKNIPSKIKFVKEILSLSNKNKNTFKKQYELHKKADVNRAFAHYRWS